MISAHVESFFPYWILRNKQRRENPVDQGLKCVCGAGYSINNPGSTGSSGAHVARTAHAQMRQVLFCQFQEAQKDRECSEEIFTYIIY
jgi:hypothetical protein